VPDSSFEITVVFHSATFSIRPVKLSFGAVNRTLSGARFMGKCSMSFLITLRACKTKENTDKKKACKMVDKGISHGQVALSLCVYHHVQRAGNIDKLLSTTLI